MASQRLCLSGFPYLAPILRDSSMAGWPACSGRTPGRLWGLALSCRRWLRWHRCQSQMLPFAGESPFLTYVRFQGSYFGRTIPLGFRVCATAVSEILELYDRCPIHPMTLNIKAGSDERNQDGCRCYRGKPALPRAPFSPEQSYKVS